MTTRGFRRIGYTGALALALATSTLHAQSAGDVITYTPASFADANPADAYDLLRRLPGFSLVEGDDEVRGYAGAAGNVLFDGKPPSSKQESIEDLLRRIPISAVERVEIIRGGARGIDMAGYAVIANVVRKRAVATEASVEAGAVAGEGQAILPTITVDASRLAGERRLQAAFSILSEVDEDTGDGQVLVLGEHEASEAMPRTYSEILRTLSGSGEYETPLAGGTLTTNASLKRESSRVAIDTDERVRELERLTSAEFGGRYRRQIAAGTGLEALTLRRDGWLRASETSEEGDESEAFREATRTSETIARLSLRREGAKLSVEAAAEGAINTLRSHAALEENDVAVELPGSDANVCERRGEASLGLTWKPRGGITVDGALRVEASTIRSTGDTASKESFLFLKPRLAASFALGSDQLRIAAERGVGQLDFGDFVASASLERGQVSAGAAALRPPSTWSFSSSYEHRFWDKGSITATIRHERISDVIDRVILIDDGEIFDAVGNIGSGRRTVGEVELTMPLQQLGFPGAQLKSSLSLLRSRVTDPVTGERREISEDKPVKGKISIEQNLFDGALGWGGDLSLRERKREYRFDEVRTEYEGARLGLWVEYRPVQDWRVRLQVENLNAALLDDRREEYDGPRSTFPVSNVERRLTNTARTVQLTVRKSFGGK